MIHRPRGREKKPVVCINTGMVYDSIEQAARLLNISKASVSTAVIQDKMVKGYLFKVHQN